MENKQLQEIINTTIQTQIVAALNEAPEVIEKLILASLSAKVDDSGRIPQYPSHAKKTYLEFLVGDEIRKFTQKLVQEYLEQNKERFSQKIKETLESGTFSTDLSKVVSDILCENYRWSINLKINPN